MVNLAPPAGAKQAAFNLGRNVVAHALDFDASVLPCSVLLPHAGALDSAVLAIFAATIDEAPVDLPPGVVAQAQLPASLA
eukprot:10965647-Lingulodinium_polyedra.AAC.1